MTSVMVPKPRFLASLPEASGGYASIAQAPPQNPIPSKVYQLCERRPHHLV